LGFGAHRTLQAKWEWATRYGNMPEHPSFESMNEQSSVLIRPYRIDDASLLFNAARESISELMPWMPWCHPHYSYNESQSWIETQVAAFTRREAFAFGIVSDDGSYLGGCGLNQIDQRNRRANLGYWVRSTATRRGVATAATRLLRDWGFENCDLIRLEIVIGVGNLASQRVAEKAGAIREGILRNRLVLHGQPHDAVMFSFIR
jgi:ribosomal-protein-serine acetyltransferase